ncbi:MAG: Wzz/FepE/Etk N-terminal domain-containing protein, partial [Patescibacteria group bacterium]|nr:Wzz/FepE/Etk N-terminal domain-containing protein [Patescibacteria group bacterium]
MKENQQSEYEEVNLMDYVKVIIKRRKLIAQIFVISVIIAGVISFMMPKIYKISTSLNIGYSITQDGLMLIESPDNIISKINNDVYGVSIRNKLNISESSYPKIKAENKKGTELLNITIESSDTNQAQNILKAMNDLIINEHQKKIKLQKELTEK